MSEGVLLASVIIRDFLGGFSTEISCDLLSRDRRWAATFPKTPLLRSIELFEDSFNESFEPKLFLRNADDVIVVVLDLREALDVLMIFVPIGGFIAAAKS